MFPLFKALNFTYEVVPSVDGTWGSMQKDGSYSGMIGMLQRKEHDVIIASLTVRLRGSKLTFYLFLCSIR